MEKTQLGETLVGKVITSILIEKYEYTISCNDGTNYRAYHMQDCCERVEIVSIHGDISNILGQKITLAECIIDRENRPKNVNVDDSFTITTHIIGTQQGQLVINWLGTSNGYYSESVYFQLSH
jgi:hypothetical protein